MDMKANDGRLDIRSLLKRGTSLSELRLEHATFRLADEGPGEDSEKNLPVRRDDVWQDMLRMVLGHVPEGAEHAPSCNCQLVPIFEKCDFAGLAGLPPAVRLMDGFFPVRDQSKRGACFAFALVSLCEYMLGKTVELSEQSLFHFTKLVTPGKVEKLTDGAFTLDAIHAIEEYGICPLSEWHYNPESWNYVEDPYNEGQGMALQRKLSLAQKYRFRHWRTLSEGAVLQFKQALSAGFPVYTGVLVTSDWDDDDVHRTGVIPVPKLFWQIRIMAPPRGLVEDIMAENGIDPESDEAKAIGNQIAGRLIQDTYRYLCTAVFGCKLAVCDLEENEYGVDLVVRLEKMRGGHALCLAGYVDDPSYLGGGYFIARNSWSDTEWAPESPEMPGYALIPYAYITAYGQEGVVMSEFPDTGVLAKGGTPPPIGRNVPLGSTATEGNVKACGAIGRPSLLGMFSTHAATGGLAAGSGSSAASVRMTPSAIVPAPTDAFGTWLTERSSVLDRPVRDMDGILLRSGISVLVPDLSKPLDVLRDTKQNRDKLRAIYDVEVKKEAWKLLVDGIRKVADESFGRHSWVLSLDDIRESLAEIGMCPKNAEEFRAALLAVQKTDQKTYALCINQFGREELRHASVLGSRKRVTE